MNDMGFNIALKSKFLKLAIILIPSIFICHNSSGYGHEQIRYRGNPKESISVVQHIVYRIPNRNHTSMLRLCEKASDIFRESGDLRHEVFQLNNTDVPLGGFASIADIISAEKDEEVWLELLHFRDRKHMKKVIAKMEKDERCERSYKQSLDLLSPGQSSYWENLTASLVSIPKMATNVLLNKRSIPYSLKK